jgi:hypothetical protein
MIWTRMLAYITGTVDQELLLRNEYLTAENRILRAQICDEPAETVTKQPNHGKNLSRPRVADLAPSY